MTDSFEEYLDESLKVPENASGYLQAAMDDGEIDVFLLALQDVARASGGMSAAARRSGLNRENLYRMLSKNGNPRLRGVDALLKSLGLRLSIEPRRASGSTPKT